MNAPFPAPAIKTTCPYCGVGCGIKAKPDGFGGASIAGDVTHPANFGRLCSKGSALGETLSLEGRLLHPKLRTRSGLYETVSWDTALDRVAEGLAAVGRERGPEAIAFYLSGQLLTEDYYAANKLAKGFLGTPHVDTNSRLCMASSVAGHRRAFGADLVPGSYADLDNADLIVLVGSNTAWCHPVLFQRIQKKRTERGAKLIVIDPRRNATAEEADLFLPIAPGSDTVLFAYLLIAVEESSARDAAFIGASSSGHAEALAAAQQIAPDLETVAARTGLSASDIEAFAALWLGTEKTVTAWSQGVNQSSQGTDKVNAIINCHLATGRIGKPGMGPFSLTGQPNAMGGREVGGLANMLAAHMNYGEADRDRVRRFWRAPRLAAREGLKAVALFDSIARNEIGALWVMATNPAVSMPDAGNVQAALGKLDLFIVSDVVFSNDTIAQGPHVLLPAAAWGEKDGTVTNSERRISRQRAFLPLPGEALPDWRIVAEVAKRLGFGADFAWPNAAAVFREHAALSAFENEGLRMFDIGALADVGDAAYGDLAPVQWPLPKGAKAGQEHLFGNGRFATPDGRARFVPAALVEERAPRPFLLNTGRMRDHWHTMTRTGKSARLSAHAVEPMLAVHPADAEMLDLKQQGFVRVSTAHGSAVLRVAIDEGQRRGEVFAPIHWSKENASAPVGRLVRPDVDPVSGQPDLKSTPARLEPLVFAWQGFLLSRNAPELDLQFWSRRKVEGGFATLFAHDELGWLTDQAGSISLDDAARGAIRRILVREGRIEQIAFATHDAPHAALEGLLGLFADFDAMPQAGRSLLAGGIAAGPESPVVCACFGIRRAALEEMIATEPEASVGLIGERLKAGTNCGSCLPELRSLLRRKPDRTTSTPTIQSLKTAF
jgi:assimilatory nitrate reductase catalytic subunit